MIKVRFNSELIKKIIDLYQSGKDSYQTAEECECSQTSIIKVLKNNNIERRRSQNYKIKYPSKEDFFDQINSEEKAYFLGLLYADGNNYVKGNHSYEVSIKLQERDKIILEKFRDILSPETKLKSIQDKKTRKTYCLFKINSKKISQQLSALGCGPKKSLILQYPEWLDVNLTNHFLRGYSDGDGSIYYKNKNSYISYFWSLISSNKFCQKVSVIIENNLRIHCTLGLAKPKKNKITTVLSIGGNVQIEKFFDWLYSNANIYLPRKYEKYQQFKKIRKEYLISS